MELNNISDKEIILELKNRLQEKAICEQQVKDLNISLKKLNRKLKESESMKSHFISNIRNEIINPFTSILAIAENILDVEKENWKKVIHMVSLIHTEVFNLDFQLRNIFAAAELEAGENEPDITLVNIDKTIQHVIDTFKYEARRKHLKIEYVSANKNSNTKMYFKSDAEKIQIIISNLISNAIKFSYNEGIILIKVTKQENNLRLTVKDEGQGISKTNEQIIFDRFKRIDTGINSLNRGHGLGLSIIKAMIDSLDGKIEFSSRLGKGATFTIQLYESEKETSGISNDADELFFREEKF
ncbi:MAG: HAMP domain-containing histidine kinase [Bacteroidales bacterium]|nr:HAMP domain-containing histidine kinase [Bacteroidales bacterium]